LGSDPQKIVEAVDKKAASLLMSRSSIVDFIMSSCIDLEMWKKQRITALDTISSGMSAIMQTPKN